MDCPDNIHRMKGLEALGAALHQSVKALQCIAVKRRVSKEKPSTKRWEEIWVKSGKELVNRAEGRVKNEGVRFNEKKTRDKSSKITCKTAITFLKNWEEAFPKFESNLTKISIKSTFAKAWTKYWKNFETFQGLQPSLPKSYVKLLENLIQAF